MTAFRSNMLSYNGRVFSDMIPLCDMHCHILPGVDDGVRSQEQALDLLREEYAQGVRRIILTPHFRKAMFNASRIVCKNSFLQLQKKAENEFGSELQLYLGCEFHVNTDMLELLGNEPAYRMNGSDSVLIEFSRYNTESEIRGYLHDLIMNGWQPVIAHIERYPACRTMSFVSLLRRMGAKVQVNADAMLGLDGFSTKLYVRRLLREDLIDMIGSDAHNLTNRSPHLRGCADLLSKELGTDAVRYLMWDTAATQFSLCEPHFTNQCHS